MICALCAEHGSLIWPSPKRVTVRDRVAHEHAHCAFLQKQCVLLYWPTCRRCWHWYASCHFLHWPSSDCCGCSTWTPRERTGTNTCMDVDVSHMWYVTAPTHMHCVDRAAGSQLHGRRQFGVQHMTPMQAPPDMRQARVSPTAGQDGHIRGPSSRHAGADIKGAAA